LRAPFADSFSRRSCREFIRAFSWNLPNLRTVSTTNAHLTWIPPNFNAQVKHLAVNMVGGHCVLFQLSSLQSLGRKAINATSLRLSLDGCVFKLASESSPIRTRSNLLPSLKFLDIQLLSCTQRTSSPSKRRLWRTFGKLRITSVVEMNITFDIGDEEGPLVHWRGYSTILHSILATDRAGRRNRYPLLETLNVSIVPRRQPDALVHFPEAPLATILLPHCCVPSLKHLRVSTSLALTFAGDVSNVGDSVEPDFLHYKLGGESVPIALETVTFELPQVDGVVPWVRQLASKMQEKACWDRFSELTIFQDGEVGIIQRDDVERWCDVCENIKSTLDDYSRFAGANLMV